MKTKWMANKLTIVVVLIVFIVVCIGIGALIAPNSKKMGDSNVGVETEQKEDDATVSDDTDEKVDKMEDAGAGLEVYEIYDNNTQDKSDASGNWGDETKSDSQINNTTGNNKVEQDKNNNSNDNNQGEEILRDDINWGEIY